MKITLKTCPFCDAPAAELDANLHTWCTNVACGSEAYMHFDAWNKRMGDADFTQEAYDQGFEDGKKVQKLLME